MRLYNLPDITSPTGTTFLKTAAGFLTFVYILFLTVLLFSCRQPFNITDALDDPLNITEEPDPLFINPSTVTLYIGSSLQFFVSGGTPPYSYAVTSGSGSVDTEGIYTAPDTAGTAVLTVTDDDGGTINAEITITDSQLDADYIVQSISNSPAVAESGSTIGQTFTITNQGIENGSLPVFWNAYISSDQVLDGGDMLVDAGKEAALNASGTSAPVTIGGTWNVTSGTYYLIIRISSGDDRDPANNYTASAAFTITALGSVIDYVVSGISMNYPTITAGGLCAEKFDITNIGGAPGGDPVSWTAYASADLTLNVAADFVIASGVLGSGLSSGSSQTDIAINGYWPSAAGSYYLLISVSAANEDIDTNNIGSNGPYSVLSPPDYTVINVTYDTLGKTDSLFDFDSGVYEFTIKEQDGNGGNQPIGWNVYISYDTILDGTDLKVFNGSVPALIGNGSSVVSFGDAEWPAVGGYFFIIITITSGDDSDSSNNLYVSPGTVTVPSYYDEVGTDDNSAVGPTLSAVSAVSDTASALDGAILSLNELLYINGKMDEGSGTFDTYMIETDSSVSRLEIYISWGTGINDIDFYIWDTGTANLLSNSTETATEPKIPPPVKYTVTPGLYFIGVQFLNNGLLDEPYTLIIQGK